LEPPILLYLRGFRPRPVKRPACGNSDPRIGSTCRRWRRTWSPAPPPYCKRGIWSFFHLKVLFKAGPDKMTVRREVIQPSCRGRWRSSSGLLRRLYLPWPGVRPDLPGRYAELLQLRVRLAVLALEQGDYAGERLLELLFGGVQVVGGSVEVGLQLLLPAGLMDLSTRVVWWEGMWPMEDLGWQVFGYEQMTVMHHFTVMGDLVGTSLVRSSLSNSERFILSLDNESTWRG